MSGRIEVGRRTHAFQGGAVETIACLVCHKPVRLHFNGGKLDSRECCGHRYTAELEQIDIVIYGPLSTPPDPKA